MRSGRVNCWFAGRGNPRPYLKRMPPGAAGRVRFLGPVSDMAACYAAADVFVAPTLYDPFSNACLEALAAGLPVLTTPANGFSEILTPGRDGEVIASPADPTPGRPRWPLGLTPHAAVNARADCAGDRGGVHHGGERHADARPSCSTCRTASEIAFSGGYRR